MITLEGHKHYQQTYLSYKISIDQILEDHLKYIWANDQYKIMINDEDSILPG